MAAFALIIPVTLALAGFEGRTITLQEAERTADSNQPLLRAARAGTAAGAARADEARAPVLPQAKLTGEYLRTTGNREHKPGSATTTDNRTDTFNWFDFRAEGSFVLWDFGQTRNRWHAAEARAAGLGDSERATQSDVLLGVRTAYFRAQAQKSLIVVAREALANRQRHLDQITGFVTAGTRPEIDLAQARADRALARVQVINAENGYAVARAELNQATGIAGPIDYEVGDEVFAATDAEGRPVEALVDEALRTRPTIAALDNQIRAQELTARAIRGAYWPTLNLVAGALDQGTNLTSSTGIGLTSSDNQRAWRAGMAWNYFGGVNLAWPIFEGFLTGAQLRESSALLDGLRAQRDAIAQDVWVTVQRAQLGVRAAGETLLASEEGLTSAVQRLALAEGRYEAGAGSAIELGDAQLGQVTAAAQKVSASYGLAEARAELLHALGRH